MILENLPHIALTRVFEHIRDPEPDDLVTVAVSVFNYERFLTDCLDSVVRQHHRNIDLIVVDDASDLDDSCGRAKRWLEENHQRFARALLVRTAEQ